MTSSIDFSSPGLLDPTTPATLGINLPDPARITKEEKVWAEQPDPLELDLHECLRHIFAILFPKVGGN